jgi:hypothetical protein
VKRTVGGQLRVTKKAAKKRVTKKVTLKEYARAIAPKRGPRKRTKQ